MSFSKYEAYKDSGMEWLGEVPKHWIVSKIKFFCYVNDGNHGEEYPKGNDFTDSESGVPFIRGGNIDGYSISSQDLLYISTEKNDSMRKGRLKSGDLLFVNRGEIGRVAIIPEDFEGANLNSQIAYLRISNKLCENGFLLFFLDSRQVKDMIASCKEGSVLTQFPIYDLVNINVSLPPSLEQTQIARFLDHETARIDALIAEQQRLIELLKEKRQAVISHAVTKGLDPTVPMKDSGVEWLEEVPKHWDISCLKRFWFVTDCKHITAEFVEDGIPLASIREVQSRFVNLDNAKKTTELFYEQLIESDRKPLPGDLIFSRNATVGEVAQVATWHPSFAMGQDVCLLRKQLKNFSSDYLQAVLRSPIIIEQLENLMVGATFKRINVEEIRGLVVPMPPQNEQTEIASYLKQETDIFETLLSEAKHAINLLQERRSALISAAVTGKIDVRNWQLSTSSQTEPAQVIAKA